VSFSIRMIERRLRNVVISAHGCSLRREGDMLRVVWVDGDEERVVRVSPHEVEQVIVAGEASVSTGAIRLLVENSTDLVFVSHRPSFFARVVRSDSNMITELWRRQIAMGLEERMAIAREILLCATYNKLRMLQSIAKNRDVDFHDEIEHITSRKEQLAVAESTEELMGAEGEVARVYFGALRRVIPSEMGFERREKHPPHDPVNSLLSYGYTVLHSRVEWALMLAGLNPYEGVLHVAYRNRPALSFDLMEEFRQPIVDRVVLTLIARGSVRVEDFDRGPEMCYMSENVKRMYLDALYTRMEQRYMYGGKRVELLDVIHGQARKLASAIRGDCEYRGFKWR